MLGIPGGVRVRNQTISDEIEFRIMFADHEVMATIAVSKVAWFKDPDGNIISIVNG